MSDVNVVTYDEIPKDTMQLPETMECIKTIEELYYNSFHQDSDFINNLGIKKGIIFNPMLHLANAITVDCDGNRGWAKDLAKYLCTMCGLECLDLKTERDYFE